MATDKTIWECPVYTLVSQLDGAQRLVIQSASAALNDNGVPLSLLGAWIFQNNNIGIFGGSANPDPAVGQNGDEYFQSNSKIYQKLGGGWVLKATIGSVTPIIHKIDAGSSIPYFLAKTVYPQFTINAEIITKATSYDPTSGVATGRLQRWSDIPIEDQDTAGDGTGTFTGWNIYGHDDGTVHFKEDTYLTLKA